MAGVLPDHFSEQLVRERETGMGYQIVSVWLNDGRRFDQVVLTGGHVTQVRGYPEVPFEPLEVKRIKVTHKKWDFRGEREDFKARGLIR